MDFGASTNLERLSREVFLCLHASINAEIAVQASLWAPRDQQFSAAIGTTYSPLYLEPITTPNFHLGHTPSLIEAPIEKYPNISVMGETADKVEDDFTYDQGGEWYVGVSVELMCKSVVDEDEVYRRIARTADAANNVLMRNKTLNGLVELVSMENQQISDSFIRKELKSRGTDWFWQGSRLEYIIQVNATYKG
jgi:hypothetical protein